MCACALLNPRANLGSMASREYTNPIYPEYFADPFVWKHDGVYYAVGTSPHKSGVFTLLRSEDFVNWKLVGPAMERLHPDFGDAYWAPEVAYADGRFWMYYSVGRSDKSHHIRVATSEKPQGPFRDTGNLLTSPFTTPFAIDACPFRDDDGQWYLFYARDFLDTENGWRVGTGVVVDRLIGMTKLAGDPRLVVRARFDWQRFVANRVMYGGVYDWHTIEGPFVVKRHGKYWCLFSAGRWENESYGVDWAVADHVTGPYRYDGNTGGARLLRTVPGRVLGPGHNSLATAPTGTDYIVYHAWDAKMTARRLCIDPVDWMADGPRSPGPTFTPQKLV